MPEELFLSTQAILTGSAVVFTGGVGYSYHPEPLPFASRHTHQLRPLLQHLVELVETAGLSDLQDTEDSATDNMGE